MSTKYKFSQPGGCLKVFLRLCGGYLWSHTVISLLFVQYRLLFRPIQFDEYKHGSYLRELLYVLFLQNRRMLPYFDLLQHH